jgi:riboflavin biosynthesis pyrimidine reductase
MVFSVWHPELIALRRDLGKPRHPSQIVASVGGNLEVENGLMFNQTEVPVFVLTTDRGKGALAGALSRRPWIHLINMGEKPALEEALHRLCRSFGIRSISAVGGRTIATALLDAGLVQDLYLTTSPRRGGDPGTPYYTGEQEIKKQLVVRKEGRAEEAGVLFEHFAIDGK